MALFSVGEGTADKFVAFLLRDEVDVRAVVDPPANTTTILYDSFVVPTLTRHEKDIDTALGMAQEQATNRGAELSKQGLTKLYQLASEGLLKTGLYNTSDTSTSQAPHNSKENNQESSLSSILFRRNNAL
ncbi:5331_t:CDS:2 [Cetraspora pellucida]|uniref:5331_t:CDS:1 n=1 Tax=Cetraspora pellucida TaxID=1433469 RepID=A0A9N9DQP6_9GLOM|nr:5331_t:CDS:2 [Cetraspora pellucida]